MQLETMRRPAPIEAVTITLDRIEVEELRQELNALPALYAHNGVIGRLRKRLIAALDVADAVQ